MSNKNSKSRQAKIIIISGPSGCGKTTLHKALLEAPLLKEKLVKSISATTRNKRPGEVSGKDYIFLTTKAFEDKINKGYFLEWEKVFERYYGTPKKQALDLLKKGINVLLCIDVKGAKTVAQEFPEALKIFIKAPSLKVLENRLKARGSESKESLALRLKIARKELKEAKHYDYVVINADLTKALSKLQEIVCKEIFPIPLNSKASRGSV